MTDSYECEGNEPVLGRHCCGSLPTKELAVDVDEPWCAGLLVVHSRQCSDTSERYLPSATDT
jgi:hypothetical protein